MLYRKFQVEKSAALGLLLPQSLELEVKAYDGQDRDLGLAYRTTSMKWWECMATLPPKFLVLSAGDGKATGANSTLEVEAAIAKISRPLMNLPPKNRARIEMGYASELFRSPSEVHQPPTEQQHREWEIRQKGFKRQWTFYPHTSSSSTSSPATGPAPDPGTTFTWKGSHAVLDSLPPSDPPTTTRPRHGNLKLLGPDGALLAAWKSRRDSKVLGTLYVFDEPALGGALPVDVLVTTCLYVVVVERILWTTFFGG